MFIFFVYKFIFILIFVLISLFLRTKYKMIADALLSICDPASVLCDVNLTENGATCVHCAYFQMWLSGKSYL